MGNRRGLAAALAALSTMVGLAAFAASAQADLSVSASLQLSVKPTAPYIEGALTVQTQPLDSAGNLVCGPGQTVGGYDLDGQPVSQALCAIPMLDYQFVTRFKRSREPDILRRHTALFGTPTPLNVDTDLQPDLVGTLSFVPGAVGLSATVSLKIERVLTELGEALPVKVEAIVDDPTLGSAHRDCPKVLRKKINVGYDERDNDAPRSWQATATLSQEGGNPKVDIEKDVDGAQKKITTVGGLFHCDAINRKDPIVGEIAYALKSGQTTLKATLGVTLGSYMEVRAGAGTDSNLPTDPNPRVDIKARAKIISGPRKRLVNVNLDKLPQELSVRLDEEPAANERKVTYKASADVPSLDATYTDSVGDTLATKVVAKATGLPTGMVLHQTGARAATFQTNPGGTLGSVEVGYANGEPRLLDATHPYAHIFDDGTLKSYAARIDALQSASVDATTKISAELQLGPELGPEPEPEPRKPFRALVETPGRRIDGLVENLPRHLKVLYDADGGIIDYDAFDETIDRITLKAEQTTPFFGRVTRIHGHIANVPAANTINFRQSDGALTLAATNPLGTVTLLASDGSDAPAVDGSYAWYEDTPSRFRAFARISGLKGVSFAGDPVAASFDTSSAQVLNLHAETGGVTFDSVIDKLPPHVGFTLTPGPNGKQVIDYDTNGTKIDKITVDAKGLPLPNGADKLHAEIEGLPSHMTLTLPAAGGTIVFDPYGDHIGRVLAQAYGAAGPANAAAGRQLLHYNESKAQITVDVRSVGALSATQSASPLNLSYDISSAPLDFGVALSDGKYLNGTISNPQPATIFVDPSGGATAVQYQVQPLAPNFRGNGEIDRIDIYTNAAGGYVEGHLSNIPARLYVCVQSETGTRCKPTWVPLTTVADGDTYSVPDPSFAFQLLPSDLNNQVPADRLTLNGIICIDQEDPALCKDASKKNERIIIDDLMFNTVEAAFGHRDEGCDVACGRVWAGFNTEGDNINGRVRYMEQGASGPLADFRAPNPDSFLRANRKFYFLHYDIVSFDPFDDSSSGSISCGSPRPNLEIEVPGFNPDLLTGNNIPGDGLCG